MIYLTSWLLFLCFKGQHRFKIQHLLHKCQVKPCLKNPATLLSFFDFYFLEQFIFDGWCLAALQTAVSQAHFTHTFTVMYKQLCHRLLFGIFHDDPDICICFERHGFEWVQLNTSEDQGKTSQSSFNLWFKKKGQMCSKNYL